MTPPIPPIRPVGVIVIILAEMIICDVSVFSILVLLFSLATGFCYVLLMPNSAGYFTQEATYPYLSFWNHPLLMPLWGFIGDFDKEFLDEASSDEDITNFLLPLVLFTYMVFTSIVLVNLLIAQMSSTFERVKETGHLRWQFNRTQLVREFKDTKSPVPPPLNLLRLVVYDLPRAFTRLILGKWLGGDGAARCVGFTQEARGSELRAVMRLESKACKTLLAEMDDENADSIDTKVEALQERIEEAEKNAIERHEAIMGLIMNLKSTQA